MGCHTWFYTPYKNFNLKEARLKLKEKFERKLKENTPDFLEKEIVECILEDYPDFFGDRQRYYKTMLRFVDKFSEKTIKELFCDKFNDEFGRTLKLADDGQIYVELSGENLAPESEWFHDCFRRYGYPDHILRSYRQTMRYINCPLNKCVTKKETNQRIKEFWKKHPDGYISFG